MAIRKNKSGRPHSVRTPDEMKHSLADAWSRMTKTQQEFAKQTLLELQLKKGKSTLLDTARRVEYDERPVPVRQFLTDSYFLGEAVNVYPVLLNDIEEIFAGDYEEVIFGGAIGYGKCVAPDTEVYDTSTGRRRRVDEVGEFAVASVNDATGKVSSESCTAFPSGKKPCVELGLAGGQSITLSTDHPVLTARGWVKAAELTMSDLVATPRSLPAPDKHLEITDDEVKLVAYLVADGGCTAGITFTNAISKVLEEFTSLVKKLGDTSNYGNKGRWKEAGTRPTKRQNSGEATQLTVCGVKDIVRRWGLIHPSREKRVPAEFYGLPNEQIALFLNRFWTCDGSIYSNKGPRRFELALASEGLVDDLRHMLLRLGIQSRKYYKRAKFRGSDGERKESDAWQLIVSEADNIRRFSSKVGPIFGKEDWSAVMDDAVAGVKANPNSDIVPVSLNELKEIRDELGSRGAGLLSRFGCGRQGSYFSRPRFERFCEAEGYTGKYSWLANTDLLWERIRYISDEGEKEVYDLNVPETSCFIGNQIVVHNTFAGRLIEIYMVYETLCLKDPQIAFGLSPDSAIHFVNVSKTEKLAKKIVFDGIGEIIKKSVWFQKHGFHATNEGISFEKNVHILGGASGSDHIIGSNAYGGIIDEANFLISEARARELAETGKDKATDLYNNIKRRMRSRFLLGGKLPGKLIIISSKRTKEDFTERRIREAEKQEDPKVFYREYSTWEVNRSAYDTKTFRVFVGDETTRSRILEEGEEDPPVPEGCRIIEVPDEWRSDFEADIDSAIRDDAGFATVVIEPFITMRERLDSMVDPRFIHPFHIVDWVCGEPLQAVWSRVVDLTIRKPHCCQNATRHAHVDASLNSCNTGFAVGHICGSKKVTRREGLQKFETIAPVVRYDVVLRVIPPKGGEILQAEVINLIVMLTKVGLPIRSVSMDRWQYVGLKQSLENDHGYETEIRSCHHAGPYDVFKQGIYEERVKVYDYPPLFDELRQLEKNHKDGKVLKPPGGYKDVADAACCVFTHFAENPPPGGLPPPSPGESSYPAKRAGAQPGPAGSIFWEDETPRQYGDAPEEDDFVLPPFM